MIRMPSKRATSRGRVRRDFSRGAYERARLIRREWEQNEQLQHQERGQMNGGLAGWLAARPAPPAPSQEPTREEQA